MGQNHVDVPIRRKIARTEEIYGEMYRRDGADEATLGYPRANSKEISHETVG